MKFGGGGIRKGTIYVDRISPCIETKEEYYVIWSIILAISVYRIGWENSGKLSPGSTRSRRTSASTTTSQPPPSVYYKDLLAQTYDIGKFDLDLTIYY